MSLVIVKLKVNFLHVCFPEIIAHLRTFVSQSDSSIQRPRSIKRYNALQHTLWIPLFCIKQRLQVKCYHFSFRYVGFKQLHQDALPGTWHLRKFSKSCKICSLTFTSTSSGAKSPKGMQPFLWITETICKKLVQARFQHLLNTAIKNLDVCTNVKYIIWIKSYLFVYRFSQ